MDLFFLDALESLRVAFGKALFVTSGYRCQVHNKACGGALASRHLSGQAVDIAISGADAARLVQLAPKYGLRGIGVKQHGTGRFIHLDLRPEAALWSYA